MSNLPPGVSPNDIPGNRPEDSDAEEFFKVLDEMFIKVYGEKGKKWLVWQEHIDTDDLIWEYVTLAKEMGYSKGYHEGMSDAEMEARYQEEQESLDEKS